MLNVFKVSKSTKRKSNFVVSGLVGVYSPLAKALEELEIKKSILIRNNAAWTCSHYVTENRKSSPYLFSWFKREIYFLV